MAGDNLTAIDHESAHESFKIVHIDFSAVKVPFFVTVFLLVASGMKTVFHLSSKVTKVVPESCILVILGVVASLILHFSPGDAAKDFNLNSTTFFYLLLPPIVFDAGYFMPNRAFFQNLGTILLYAVVGTIWNTVLIALILWGCDELDWFNQTCGMLPIFTFAALISAVDPVAVLAVFEEIHVNEVLHILVFGESLLNDAVTVVIYHMMETFTEIGVDNLKVLDILSGIANFLCVSLGGTTIGVLFGLLTAFVTKYTDHVRVIEPIFVFSFSYLSYICAEIFHFSGILSIVFCGITMAQYVEENISHKSHTTIKYFLKMMSSVSEAVIFLFLGLSATEALKQIDVTFVAIALFACLICRFAGVYCLTALANQFRVDKLNRSQQFIMAYGGIRGGVAFCLAVLLDEDVFGEKVKGVFVSTTIIVVFFTVFIQGMTIKPLVQVFRIKTQNMAKLNIFETMADRVVDHVMSGIEDITGKRGDNWVRVHYEALNNRYLRPKLLREKPVTSELNMMRAFSKLNIQETVNYVQSHQNMFLTPSVSQNSLTNYMRKELEKSEISGVGETCLDMKSLNRQLVLPQKILEDAEDHKATMETAFRKRSRGIVSGAQTKFTDPRHAIPSRKNTTSDIHHMQYYTALKHHLINSRLHKKSVGGSYCEDNNHLNRPSVSFVLPTPSADDLGKHLNANLLVPNNDHSFTSFKEPTDDGFSHGKNGRQRSSSGLKPPPPYHSQASFDNGRDEVRINLQHQNSCDNLSDDEGIVFAARPRAAKVSVSENVVNITSDDEADRGLFWRGDHDEEKTSSEGNTSVDSAHNIQSLVAIEAYLPWKEGEMQRQSSLVNGLDDPKLTEDEGAGVNVTTEEAPPSQAVFLPPGRDMTLEEWDKELPPHLMSQSPTRRGAMEKKPGRHEDEKKRKERRRKRHTPKGERQRKVASPGLAGPTYNAGFQPGESESSPSITGKESNDFVKAASVESQESHISSEYF